MMNRTHTLQGAITVLCAAALLLMPGMRQGLSAKAPLKAGDVVWAEWQPNDWYHGKITKQCDLGWHILYDDGDQKCCSPDKVVKDVAPPAGQVKKGSRVLAEWTNGKYYPGVVASIEGDQYSIQFDDGDKRTVGLQLIRLR